MAVVRRPLGLTPSQRATLERWANGRRTPYRVVIRSRIVLRASDGVTNRQIARELRVSPITVACWISRFGLLGLDGIARDAPRFGSRRSLPDAKVQEILEAMLHGSPANGLSWSSRSLARATGVSHTTVLRVWKAHHVERGRTRLSSLSHDPRFLPRSIGVSGVYLNPPHGAVVISDHISGGSRPAPHLPPESTSKPGSRSPSAAESTSELTRLLSRLESFPSARSSARLTRKEFLAFLGSVADHGTPGEQSHLLLSTPDDSLRSVAVRGGSRVRGFSVVGSEARVSLHELVGRWLSERSRHPRTEIALDELPRLRQALERWTTDFDQVGRPFAWVRSRTR